MTLRHVLGRVAPQHLGAYDPQVQYFPLQEVYYDYSTFRVKLGPQPPVGTLPTDEDYWTMIASGIGVNIIAGAIPELTEIALHLDDILEARNYATQATADIFPNTVAGLAATANGGYFYVPSSAGGEALTLFRRTNATTAEEITTIPSNIGITFDASAVTGGVFNPARIPAIPPIAHTHTMGQIDGLNAVITNIQTQLSGVITTVNWNDVQNKPTFSAVALSGSYSDLSGRPTLGNVAARDVGTAAGNVPLLDGGGKLNVGIIPALPGQEQVVTTTIAAMTSGQQALVVTGTIVTTDNGQRWVYKGSGSKTLEASYVSLIDAQPEWSVINNRPSTFPPSPHTHPISAIDNLQAFLDAKAGLQNGRITSAAAPERLSAGAVLITDWNLVTESGWYYCNANTPNAPTTAPFIGRVTGQSANWLTQEVWPYTTNTTSACLR